MKTPLLTACQTFQAASVGPSPFAPRPDEDTNSWFKSKPSTVQRVC